LSSWKKEWNNWKPNWPLGKLIPTLMFLVPEAGIMPATPSILRGQSGVPGSRIRCGWCRDCGLLD